MIDLRRITRTFPAQERKSPPLPVLSDITLRIPPGQYAAMVGASGSGKSTLMNILGCLDRPTSGVYRLHGRDVSSLPPDELAKVRGEEIGFVFQGFQLIPRLTAIENVMLPLILQGVSEPERRARAEQLLLRVGLHSRMHHLPAALSGGQQQRVAIARALVKMPRVLLLDEPLSNLDARLRLQTREEIRRIQRETKITTVFVTHDQEEAMSISDMIVVMKKGVVQQVGEPQKVYDDPVNLFVAKFLGTPPINVFTGRVEGEKLMIGDEAVLDVKGAPDGEVYAAVRPEGFILDENGPLTCKLSGVEVMGRDVSIVSRHKASVNPIIRAIIGSDNKVDTASATVRFSLKPHKTFIFGKDSEERIRFGE